MVRRELLRLFVNERRIEEIIIMYFLFMIFPYCLFFYVNLSSYIFFHDFMSNIIFWRKFFVLTFFWIAAPARELSEMFPIMSKVVFGDS